MSQTTREPSLTDRLSEQPRLSGSDIAKTRPRDLLARFAAGGVTSIAAGIVTLVFGPRVGGVLLAFPAILAASLTLIEEEEDAVDAREDARGAIAGGLALALFALIAAVLVLHIPGGWALAVAALSWAAGAGGLYLVLWWR